jgi:hypothetical protein
MLGRQDGSILLFLLLLLFNIIITMPRFTHRVALMAGSTGWFLLAMPAWPTNSNHVMAEFDVMAAVPRRRRKKKMLMMMTKDSSPYAKLLSGSIRLAWNPNVACLHC